MYLDIRFENVEWMMKPTEVSKQITRNGVESRTVFEMNQIENGGQRKATRVGNGGIITERKRILFAN
jgi:hypothetical protein